MEVNATAFPGRLLGILIAISEADFVSFDLELSGIPSRIPGTPRARDRQTLEERYVEAKAGAERHQILQFGFTCAKFDYALNAYVLRPYNVNISPLIDERLDIEREFTFQTGAISFLLRNGFRMDLPFTHGVQYLSRDEAALAKQLAYNRIDKKNVVGEIQLKETDIDSLDFIQRVREEIIKWKSSGTTSLLLHSHTGKVNPPAIPVISRFEKRLVHQLIRAEFTNLVAMGRNDCIKVVYYDSLREEDNRKRMKSRVKESINRQTGFRWVVEALSRGDVDIDPKELCRDLNGDFVAGDLDNIKLRLERAKLRIRDQQPVLVGHNMFSDIIYLYRCFIGQLPDNLQQFCDSIHRLFPRIVDTKYLATHDGGDLNASPTLQEIAESLEMQELPDIVIHPDHSKYDETEAYHEAGYDSLLTATIMLRLSTKLHAVSPIMSPTDNAAEGQFGTTAGPLGRQRTTNNGSEQTIETITSRFACTNVFQSLETQDTDPSDWTPAGSPKISWDDQPYEGNGDKLYPIETLPRRPMEMLPDFESTFWSKFGNKLRVFGTQETVLKLADWETPLRPVEMYESS